MSKSIAYYQSPLGILQITSNGVAITAIRFVEEKPQESPTSSCPIISNAIAQLEEYFDHKRREFDLPLAPQGGTPFMQHVWSELLKIAYGNTTSYKQIATACGNPKAFRAVGTAIGKNPIAIIVPCHRIVPASGGIGNYAYGKSIKNKLLELEFRSIK
ncbi:MAG: methylated-DNA--[protein]-cysteine S-methyltransferase [Tannerellaceae bacterium]